MDIAIPAGHIVKMKESEKIYKYLDLAWEVRKLNTKKSPGDVETPLKDHLLTLVWKIRQRSNNNYDNP